MRFPVLLTVFLLFSSYLSSQEVEFDTVINVSDRHDGEYRDTIVSFTAFLKRDTIRYKNCDLISIDGDAENCRIDYYDRFGYRETEEYQNGYLTYVATYYSGKEPTLKNSEVYNRDVNGRITGYEKKNSTKKNY